jgi:hypothetical protein
VAASTVQQTAASTSRAFSMLTKEVTQPSRRMRPYPLPFVGDFRPAKYSEPDLPMCGHKKYTQRVTEKWFPKVPVVTPLRRVKSQLVSTNIPLKTTSQVEKVEKKAEVGLHPTRTSSDKFCRY